MDVIYRAFSILMFTLLLLILILVLYVFSGEKKKGEKVAGRTNERVKK